ncbi:MAG: type IX secretion system outer membrane channel protein PorV [Bacteroidota bacterium]
MFRKGLVGMFVLSSINAFAQPTGTVSQNDLQLNTITTALPFMSITPDSRAGAMGDAGTALSGDANSIYWNTSALIFAKSKSEIAISYTPWLRQLTNDIHLSYLSGYYKISDRHVVGGALRFFSLGEITFTDASGNVIGNNKPSEFELNAGYGFKLANKWSLGVTGKFAYSNLTGGLPVAGVLTKPGIVGAADISVSHVNEEAKIGKIRGTYTFATTINNIGNKVAYSELSSRDFIPMNLKIGNSFNAEINKFNTICWAIDLQKLLVPTPAIYELQDDEYVLISGKSNDVGVISGLFQSFGDAPGTPVQDEDGDYVQNADGSYQIVKGTKLKEELAEINIATGFEYWYNKMLALRMGFFYENKNKGNRQYLNFGAGFRYNMFGIDISYLASVSGRNSPLANTLRFTLRFNLDGAGKKATPKTDSTGGGTGTK